MIAHLKICNTNRYLVAFVLNYLFQPINNKNEAIMSITNIPGFQSPFTIQNGRCGVLITKVTYANSQKRQVFV
uniref:Uncharacterized protein n=1 Tax=Arundo donax TaxID=35708 RepID=A0A0A9CTM6_ARUDO